MRKSTKVVALDIHKDSITVALAGRDQEGPKLYGTIPSTGEALSKLVGKLAAPETQLDAVKEAQARIKGLDQALQQTLEGWSREGETRGLMALRGVDTLTAVTTLAELGDLTRFDSPRQLMAFGGLVPSEHSSGSRRQRGAPSMAARIMANHLSSAASVLLSASVRAATSRSADRAVFVAWLLFIMPACLSFV